MTEIYSVAALPENGYQLFKSTCSQYEKGRLKDQRTLPKDLRGKPSFRPAYVRCLHGLDNVDRIELLNKVYINSILGHSRTQCPFTRGATRGSGQIHIPNWHLIG
jgi:hypothetical protein